jgi:hypothetical protein
MPPNVMIDMTAVLIPFAAGCLGFVIVVFIALLSAMISRPRPSVRVDLGGALPTSRRAPRATAAA